MPVVTITKRHEWDMGHRLGKGYTSRCRHLHGHRYVAEMTFTCEALDSYDMVVDFGTLKQVCGAWIDEHFDHATLVYDRDKELVNFLDSQKNRHYVVPFNTTVENIVAFMATKLQEVVDGQDELRKRHVKLVRLKVNETPNGWAIWECA